MITGDVEPEAVVRHVAPSDLGPEDERCGAVENAKGERKKGNSGEDEGEEMHGTGKIAE